MENVDEQLKINIRSILCSISDDTVSGIIQALKYAGLETMSDLQFAHEEDLILVLKPIPRRKLIKAWSEQSFSLPQKTNLLPSQSALLEEAKKDFETSTRTSENSDLSSPQKTNQFPPQCAFLEEAKTDSETCQNSGFSSPQKTNLLPPQSALLEEAKKDFETSTRISENSVFLPPKKPNALPPCTFKWKKKRSLALLKIYAKHKTDFLCPDDEKWEVWENIADDIRKKYSSYCDASSCFCKIKELRREYEEIKNKPVITQRLYAFLEEAKPAFETSENSDASNNIKVFWTWTKPRSLHLLRVYTKYKPELLRPEAQEQEIWKKIALEVRKLCIINCDEVQCHNRIDEMKHEYEAIKNVGVRTRKDIIFLNEGKIAFETIENSVSFSTEKSSNPLLPEFHRKLLQMYTQYKTEFAHPDIEEQEVWRKIAKELKDKFSYHCTESSCRFEISQLKSQYENFKKDDVTSKNMSSFFEEAQKAFETTENHDIPNCQNDGVKKTIGKYIPPHMRNGDNKKAKSPEITNTTFSIKVMNLSEEVTEYDLRELFKCIGGAIPYYIRTMKEKSDPSKYVAYLKFDKEEDAVKAILNVDGIEYNKLYLKAEWAKS